MGSDLGNTPLSEGKELLFFFLNALLVSLDAIKNALSLLFTGLRVIGEPSLVHLFMQLVLWVVPGSLVTALWVLLGALIMVLPGVLPEALPVAVAYLVCSMCKILYLERERERERGEGKVWIS